MTEHAGIHAALAAAQGEFPEVAKTRTATVKTYGKDGKPVQYTYKFADLADIMTPLLPVLSRNGISVTQPISLGDNGRLTLLTVLTHTSGEFVQSELPLSPFPTEGKAVQTWGGVLTYARRYMLSALIGLAVEEDDDANRPDAVPDVDVNDDRGGPPRDVKKPPYRAPMNVSPQPRRPVAKPPAQEVDEALAPSNGAVPIVMPAAASDPWNLAATPRDQIVPTIVTFIELQPWPDVQAALRAYNDGRFSFSDEEEAEIITARKARKERVRAEIPVTAAG